MKNESAHYLIDEAAIVRLINRFYFCVDRRDYAEMRECLAERVDFDYSRLSGGVMPSDADELIEKVRLNHRGLRGLQHLTSNHVVSVAADSATCEANFRAIHYFPNGQGDSLWTVGGRYQYSLVRSMNGWLICGCVIYPAWTQGNPNIFQLAQQTQTSNQ